MRSVTKKAPSFKAGMYLLETLTSGMYNEPLSIYREYIQNAVDSIDLVVGKKRGKHLQINIDLDPFKKRICICDNGMGLTADTAERTLSNIGSSEKKSIDLRGFRGIGRLGGLAFSNRATFLTKASGEQIESIQGWDSQRLRKYMSNPNASQMSLQQLFKRITKFSQENNKPKRGSYFKVILDGVSSFRNYVFDIDKVRNYLADVAPLPFNPDLFSFGDEIDNYLRLRLSHYRSYNIILNGDKVNKGYKDKIKSTKKAADHIDKVKLFDLEVEDKPVAYGWYGERRDFLGGIAKGDNPSGIRVRVGNILLGDQHLLDGCFREARFNSYLVGEIHVDHPALIPNSRRDDFVDNEMKTRFFDAIEREIGLPLSKEIRYRSRINSKPKKPLRSINNVISVTNSKPSGQNVPSQSKCDRNKREAIDILKEVNQVCKGCPQLSDLITIITKTSI